MAETFDVVVVGCGIAGASLSWYLARKGVRVLTLERDRPAGGGTGLSAAITTSVRARCFLLWRAMPDEVMQDAPIVEAIETVKYGSPGLGAAR